jgi:hypothetical protein
MDEVRVLVVYPASLYGGDWATGPRIKPELATLLTYLGRRGVEADMIDLEVELGNPGPGGQDEFLRRAEERLRRRAADLVVLSCWSSLQYSATIAVAEIVRRLLPAAVIAVAGYHASVRPEDFTYDGSPVNWLLVGEMESAVLEVARAMAGGDRDTASCRPLEGTPLELTAETVPDYAAYPYIADGLPSLGVFLSRGCPLNAPACLLRPGGAGWHAYPPDVALRLVADLSAMRPGQVEILDPAFGYDAAWRDAVLDEVAHVYRRSVPVVVSSRPATLTRRDLDRMYRGSLRLRLDVETLSTTLLSRTGTAPQPRRAVDNALDLLMYANAKGVPTVASFVFNQPGETRATADETLAALETFVGAAPNTSVRLRADSWAFFPAGAREADIEAPRDRFGTRIAHEEWWKEAAASAPLARAVVASHELADLPPGDESYWRPRFDELAAALETKLTADARIGLRSHESVGSAATDVPHGWWIEPRWH